MEDTDIMRFDVPGSHKIETLAWKVFLRKSGLSFKPMTPEEKKKITDKDFFTEYRNEAIKILKEKETKKEKSVHNKKYPVIYVPSDGKPKWYGGAWSMVFVYSKNHGNFVLIGYHKEVNEYLKKHYTHYFCYWSMWSEYGSRGYWKFWNDKIGIFEPSKIMKSFKYVIRRYSNNYDNNEVISEGLKFKRLPKRWIPEFDKL